MDPFDLIEKVESKETFFEFLQALMKDKIDEDEKEKINPSSPYGSGANGWENGSIAQFLEAMYSGGLSNTFPEEASWKTFAEILYLGKIYE